MSGVAGGAALAVGLRRAPAGRPSRLHNAPGSCKAPLHARQRTPGPPAAAPPAGCGRRRRAPRPMLFCRLTGCSSPGPASARGESERERRPVACGFRVATGAAAGAGLPGASLPRAPDAVLLELAACGRSVWGARGPRLRAGGRGSNRGDAGGPRGAGLRASRAGSCAPRPRAARPGAGDPLPARTRLPKSLRRQPQLDEAASASLPAMGVANSGGGRRGQYSAAMRSMRGDTASPWRPFSLRWATIMGSFAARALLRRETGGLVAPDGRTFGFGALPTAAALPPACRSIWMISDWPPRAGSRCWCPRRQHLAIRPGRCRASRGPILEAGPPHTRCSHIGHVGRISDQLSAAQLGVGVVQLP